MRTILATVAFITAALTLPARSAHALGVDEVVSRAITAQGGADKLRAIRTLRLTGTADLGGDGFSLELSSARSIRRGGRVRTEFTLQGLTRSTPTTAPKAGTSAVRGPPRSAARLRRRSARSRTGRRLRRPARRLAAEGAPRRVPRHRGRRRHAGASSCASRARTATSSTSTSIPTPLSRSASRRCARCAAPSEIAETDLGGYQQVAGVWMPFSIESGPQGRPAERRVTVERAEVNVDGRRQLRSATRTTGAMTSRSDRRGRRPRPRPPQSAAPPASRASRSSTPARSRASARATSARPR